MGQEITKSHFKPADFEQFQQQLSSETMLLKQLIRQGACSNLPPMAGLELESWLIDRNMQPSACNEFFLESLADPLANAELAKFNIEFNTHPINLTGDVLKTLHSQLNATWQQAAEHAEQLDTSLLMIGSLPTLEPSALNVNNMSSLNRYRALNKQILAARDKPINLDIIGVEHLKFDHHDVMLESATTSLQLHTQVPLNMAHHFYNASIIASAAMVAICANSPYLFGKQLWQESRIPLFEQAIETGGFNGVADGPLKRVSFGTSYANKSIFECFQENLEHFPILLPVDMNHEKIPFAHLKLHNGTIWRWNRPLLGEDPDGTPHIRIEHRTPAAGPTIIDTIANAAFYFGLTKHLCDEIMTSGLPLPFTTAKDNFYQAARHGLNGHITWSDGQRYRIHKLITTELIPRAMAGLQSLGIHSDDIKKTMAIIEHRAATQQTGSQWQQNFIQTCSDNFTDMTRQYLANQQQGKPVSQWTL